MKKLLCLFAFMLTLASYCEEELAKEDWEIVPGIISGGYSEETGPYVYRFFNRYTCPSSLAFDYGRYYIEYYQALISVGYGDYQKHGGGSLITKDSTGEITKIEDGSISLSYGCSDGDGDTISFSPTEFTGSLAPAYVYKKESVSSLQGDFYHENYNIKVGQLFRVGLTPTGGSGYYSISVGSKPAFLVADNFGSWSGTCYAPVLTSFSAIVTDIVTGETREAFATIIVSEDPVDPTFPDDTTDVDDTNDSDDTDTTTDSSDPGTSSDPGDTATDPSSSDSSGDDDTSADSGDTSSDDGGSDDGSAVDPGSTDDDPATEPDDSSSDDDETEPDDGSGTGSTTAVDPSSGDSTDSPTDSSTTDSSDFTSDTSDTSDSSGDDDTVVVVPDDTDTPDTSDGSDISDGSDTPDITSDGDTSDAVIVSDGIDDEPAVIVINGSTGSDSDTIVVTDDSVTTIHKDNYDLAIFMSMFGAITGLNGGVAAPASTSMAVQEAKGGKGNE